MTHRDELERLVRRANAQGYRVSLVLDREGRIDSVAMHSLTHPASAATNGFVKLSPLVFAEWARGRV